MRLIGLILLSAIPVFAGETAILASGSRLHVERHEVDGGKIRLFNGTGYTELPATQVQAFEPDEPALSAPVSATPAEPEPPVISVAPSPRDLADAAADKYGVPRKLVRSVIAAESGFRPNAVSPKGAIGLMQLMPPTAQELGADPHDPAQNVDAGTRYLRDLLLKYDGRLWHALAAYNAGTGAVKKYQGIPPYAETIQYINRVTRDYEKP